MDEDGFGWMWMDEDSYGYECWQQYGRNLLEAEEEVGWLLLI